MNKIMPLIALAFIFLAVPLVSAEVFQQAEPIDIRHTVTSNGSLSGVNGVNITVKDPDKNVLVAFEEMTFNTLGSQEWNYTLNSTQTSTLGTYTYTVFAFTDSGDKATSFNFEVTPTGDILSTSQGILYIFITILGMGFFMFCLYFAVTIPWQHSRNADGFIVEKADLRYVKIFLWFVCYLLLIFIFFMGEHVSASYLRLDIASNVFNGIFWFLVSFLFPTFVVLALVGFGAYFKDLEIFKAMERGVRPRR